MAEGNAAPEESADGGTIAIPVADYARLMERLAKVEGVQEGAAGIAAALKPEKEDPDLGVLGPVPAEAFFVWARPNLQVCVKHDGGQMSTYRNNWRPVTRVTEANVIRSLRKAQLRHYGQGLTRPGTDFSEATPKKAKRWLAENYDSTGRVIGDEDEDGHRSGGEAFEVEDIRQRNRGDDRTAARDAGRLFQRVWKMLKA